MGELQRPNNYLAFSIVSLLFGFLPLGIIAVIRSSRVNTLWLTGRYEEAIVQSRGAKKMAIISLAIGIPIYLLFAFGS